MISRRAVRLGVPVGIGLVSLGAALVTPSLAGAQNPSLPIVSRASLIAGVLSAKPTPFSGTVVVSSSLLGNASTVLNAVAGGVPLPDGTATVNLWYGGSGRARAQLLNASSERDLYLDGKSVWLWTSSTMTATHIVLPSKSSQTAQVAPSTMQPSTYDPQVLAQKLLTKLSSTTTISVGKPAYIGGQAAYELSLHPTDRNSLFRRVEIFIDAQNHRVLGLDVVDRGNSTVFSIRYSKVSYGAPSASVFSFTPPSGATVKQIAPTSLVPKSSMSTSGKAATNSAAPTVENQLNASHALKFVGKGWSVVGVTPAGEYNALVQQFSKSPSNAMELKALEKAFTTVSTPSGPARLLSTPLLNVLVLQNGTILVGSVDTAELVADSTLIAN
jgi:outer membrane lipoprotein-sorting protein